MVQPGVLGGTRFVARCVVPSLLHPYVLLPSHLSSNLLTILAHTIHTYTGTGTDA